MAGTSPGGSAPPGPSWSLNWTSLPAPLGAVVFEKYTALPEIVMSLIVLLVADVSVYWASCAPVVASYTNATP